MNRERFGPFILEIGDDAPTILEHVASGFRYEIPDARLKPLAAELLAAKTDSDLDALCSRLQRELARVGTA